MSTSSIYDPIALDPEGIINQGLGNSAARAIQVHEGEQINKRALLNLFKAVIAPIDGTWICPIPASAADGRGTRPAQGKGNGALRA